MAKMPLAEHDNVVKTFPPDRTDRPFTISVLPRRSRRGWPIPNAHRPKAADEDLTVDGVAVTNDVSRRYFPTIVLNTSPAPSPVNASRQPSRTTRASLGAGTVRYTFTVTDFHRLPFAGLPAHPSTASISEVRTHPGSSPALELRIREGSFRLASNGTQ